MADRGIKGVKTVAASKLDIRAPVMNVGTNSGINFHSAVLLPPPAYPLRCLSAAIKLRRARARLLRSFLLSRGFLFLFSFPPPNPPTLPTTMTPTRTNGVFRGERSHAKSVFAG